MISTEEFEKLVYELLEMEKTLKMLGDVKISTSEGPYSISEQALRSDKVPEQKQYDDMLEQYKSKKRVVDALDMIARYKLANQT